MIQSIDIKRKATNLRKSELSLQEISEKLRISKSTASLWLRNIKLDSSAEKRLAKGEFDRL